MALFMSKQTNNCLTIHAFQGKQGILGNLHTSPSNTSVYQSIRWSYLQTGLSLEQLRPSLYKPFFKKTYLEKKMMSSALEQNMINRFFVLDLVY